MAWLQEQQGRHCELDAGDEGGRRVQHEPAQGGEGREEGLEAGEELLSTEAWLVKEWLIPRARGKRGAPIPWRGWGYGAGAAGRSDSRREEQYRHEDCRARVVAVVPAGKE